MNAKTRDRYVDTLRAVLEQVRGLPTFSPFSDPALPEFDGREEDVGLRLEALQSSLNEHWLLLRLFWNGAHGGKPRPWDDEWMPACFHLASWARGQAAYSSLRRGLTDGLQRMIEAAPALEEEALHRLLYGENAPVLEGVFWHARSDLEQASLRMLVRSGRKMTEPEISRSLGREPETLQKELGNLVELGVLRSIPGSGYFVCGVPAGTPDSAFLAAP